MNELTITGANKLGLLSAELKALGEGELKREMLAGIRLATRPMIRAAKEAAHDKLPHTGGLNDVIAASKFATRTRTSGLNPAVRVVGTSGHEIKRIDEGSVVHPVYAKGENRHAWTWVTQHVAPGWFTDAMLSHSEEPRRAVIAVIDSIAARL